MTFENWATYNWHHAIMGARNPMRSWTRSDTYEQNGYDIADEVDPDNIVIGPNDMKLLQGLIKSSIKSNSNSHSKVLRQILVHCDINAPLYWWKEFDTYKVGTVANSESTMHYLASTPITRQRFQMGDFSGDLEIGAGNQTDCSEDNAHHWIYNGSYWDTLCSHLEDIRITYNETKEERYWKELIRLLPESWLQMRSCTLNYEVLRKMYFERRHHRLSEWSVDFVEWIKSLPYAKELIMYEDS